MHSIAGLAVAAEAAEVRVDTIRKIERAVITNPSVFTVQKCAVALKSNVDKLVGRR
jgi:hypothetical protein